MRNVLLGLFCSIALFCHEGFAATVPPLTGRIVDRADALLPAAEQRIETILQAFEQSTGGQLAILIEEHVPADESLEGWTLKIAEAWQLGHKGKDNGALLYLAIKDRRNRLEVGYGWEGQLPDARAGDVLRAMAPALQAGNLELALMTAIRDIHIDLTGNLLPAIPKLKAPPPPKPGLFEHILSILAIGILVLLCIRYPRLAFFILAALANGRGNHRGRGGFGGGGGFRGGGGGFGGGGASGRW